jgi:two-component sensor histidine kinase
MYLLMLCVLIGEITFANHPYHVHIQTIRGLPSPTVYDILQDKAGFIWLATEAGLCRYDGNSFNTYQSPILTSIAGSNLQLDKFGRIWYQNFDGYSYYVEDDTLRTLNQQGVFFAPNGITDDYIYTVENDGIRVYDIETLKAITHIEISPIHQIRYSGIVHNRFYFVYKDKIGFIDKNLELKWLSLVLPEGFEIPVFAQSQKRLIIFSRNQSKKYIEIDSTGKTTIQPIEGINDIILVAEVIQNNIWFCTTKGVYYSTNKKIQKWYENERISTVIKDKQNNLWVGTLDNGVFIIPMLGKSFVPIPNSNANKLFLYKNMFWVFGGTKLSVLNKEGEIKQQHNVALNNTALYYAYLDTSNLRYFTSSFGMQTGNLITNKISNYDFALKDVLPLDDKYYVWATNGNLLIEKRNETSNTSKWDKIAQKDYLRQGERFRSIAVGNNGNLYYSSNNGTYKITPDTSLEITYNGKKMFAQRMVSCSQGILALTAAGQLILIQNDIAKNGLDIVAKTGIKSFALLIRYGEHLLLAGENKILVLSQKDLSIKSIPPSFIRTADIKDICINNDSLFILLQDGIVEQPIYTNPKSMNSDFIIHKTMMNNKQVQIHQQELAYNQNNVQIHFSILDFSDIAAHRVEYRINSSGWNLIDPNVRQIQFASLSPGNYNIEFMLNGIMLDDVKLNFTIKKPFWLQWWFLAFFMMLGASSIYSYYRWQIQLIVKKNELQTEKLKLESELNRSMLTAIKSQMNPHFFYNALNTIQAYIFSNDKTNASNYLSKFSKLTRMILDMSGKERIKLSEELEALQLYLDLERMRFDKEFTYSFEIDNQLDIELIQIPSLLIQPYVENAIKHGLLHKKGAKHVSISFSKTQDGLIEIVVDDNGIGRKRSMELNLIKSQKHASFATEANQQRLEILNKGTNNKLAVTYLDKQSKEGLSLGTTVTLRIPNQK